MTSIRGQRVDPEFRGRVLTEDGVGWGRAGQPRTAGLRGVVRATYPAGRPVTAETSLGRLLRRAEL